MRKFRIDFVVVTSFWGYTLELLMQQADAAQWVTVPHQYTYGHMGSSAVIQWQYNLSSSEKFDVLEVNVIKNADRKTIAKRSEPRAKFQFYDKPITNRFNLTGEETISLLIYELVQENDNEQYCCKLSYKTYSSATLKEIKECTTLITVESPSVLYPTSSRNISAIMFKPIWLYCNVTGKPPPNITWTRSHELIRPVSSSALWLNMTVNSTDDEGQYTCHATNGFGDPSEVRFFITVTVPPVATIVPHEHYLKQGDNVTLFCNATGRPKPNLYWTKDKSDEPIGNGSRYPITVKGKYSGGLFYCRAINTADIDVTNTTITVTEYQPVDTNISTSSQTIIINQTLRITCRTDAVPSPNFTFFKDGKMDNTSRNSIYETMVTKRLDWVIFGCVPLNKYGEGPMVNISIIVNYPPLLTDTPDANYTITSSNVTILCSTTGNPTPNITWILVTNESNIDVVWSGKHFVVPYECTNTILVYRCIASNDVGNVTSQNIVITLKPGVACTDDKAKPESTIKQNWWPALCLIAEIVVVALTVLVFAEIRRRCCRRNKADANISGEVAPRCDEPQIPTRRYQVNEESPYWSPIDAVQSLLETQPSTASTNVGESDYVTVYDVGYKEKEAGRNEKRPKPQEAAMSGVSEGSLYEEITTNRRKVPLADDDNTYASVYNSRSPKKNKFVANLYVKVNKRNKKKNRTKMQEEALPLERASSSFPPLPPVYMSIPLVKPRGNDKNSPAEHLNDEEKQVVVDAQMKDTPRDNEQFKEERDESGQYNGEETWLGWLFSSPPASNHDQIPETV